MPPRFRADGRPAGLPAAAAAEGEGRFAWAMVSFETRRTLLTLPPLSRRIVYALLVVHRPSTMNCGGRATRERAASLAPKDAGCCAGGVPDRSERFHPSGVHVRAALDANMYTLADSCLIRTNDPQGTRKANKADKVMRRRASSP
jgi:hypothetical protein